MKNILTITLVLSAIVAVSQPACPTNPVPLDGGIAVLIAAGAAFGANKMYNLKKNS